MSNFEIIKQIVDSMSYLPDLSKFYISIVDIVSNQTRAENCSLMLFDKDTERLVIKAARGKKDHQGIFYEKNGFGRMSFGANEGVAGKVYKNNKSILIADTRNEKLFIKFNEADLENNIEIRSILCTPMRYNNKVHGVVNLSSHKPGAFNQDDLTIVKLIAGLASNALSTYFLSQKIQQKNNLIDEMALANSTALKTFDDKYRAFIQDVDHGIFILQDDVFVFKNNYFDKVTGLAFSDSYSRNFNEPVFISNLKRCIQEIKEKGCNQDKTSYFEFSCILENELRVELEVTVALVDYKGRPAFRGIVRDITERKKIENLKSGVLAMAAHEIRTPLRIISGYNRLLLEEEAGPINEDQQKILLECKKNCDKLTSFAQAVLDFSRISSGKINFMDFKEEDIKSCINSALKQVNFQARKKNILIQAKLTSLNLPTLFFDKNKVEQVLVNLLINAINYSGEDSKIEIEVRRPADNYLEIWVADNGIGIPQEEKESIFDEFKTGTRARTKDSFGLGLSVCKKIIELHGGRIWVEDRKEGGSKFKFTLPVSR